MRNVGWAERYQRIQAPDREQQTYGATDQPEHDAFGEQLPYDSPAPRAKREANRNFFFSDRRAREQQIRNIRAGDQQDEPDRAKQNQKRSLHSLRLLITKQDQIDSVT